MSADVSGHARVARADSEIKENLQIEKPIWHSAGDRGSDLVSGSDEDVGGASSEGCNLQRELTIFSLRAPSRRRRPNPLHRLQRDRGSLQHRGTRVMPR